MRSERSYAVQCQLLLQVTHLVPANLHVICLLDATPGLVTITSAVVRLQRFTEQDGFRLLGRQSRIVAEVELLNQLKACKPITRYDQQAISGECERGLLLS